MKCLKINKQLIEYALYEGKAEIIEGTLHTGRYKVKYSDPVKMRANVAAVNGSATVEPYGVTPSYTTIIRTDDMKTPFDENTVFWIGKEAYEENEHLFVTGTVSVDYSAGNFLFVYDDGWKLNGQPFAIADLDLTIRGTAVNGDRIELKDRAYKVEQLSPFNYIVSKVARSINSTTIALREVKVS